MSEKFIPIQHFLLDDFYIDFYTKQMRKLEATPAGDKPELLKHLALMNLFTVRRARDPGFFIHILNELSKDGKYLDAALDNARQFANKHIFHYDEDLYSFDSPDDRDHKESTANAPQGPPPSITSDDYYYSLIAKFDQINEHSKRYLADRLKQAVEANDQAEIIAIQIMLQEHTSGEYEGHHLMTGPTPYVGPLIHESWEHVMKKYVISTFRFFELYEQPPAPLGINPAISIPSLLYRDTRNKILHDILKISPIDKSLHYPDFSKSVNNTISIAAIFWFNKKSIPEKESILDSQYPFDVTEFSREQCPEFTTDASNLQSYLDTLMSLDYVHAVQLLCSDILTRSTDTDVLVTCYEALALTNVQVDEFQAAINHYQKAIGKLEAEIPNDRFHRAMLHIALAEIYLQLEDEDNAEKQFTNAEELRDQFPDEQKAILMLHTATAYRRTGHVDKEYDALGEFFSMPKGILEDQRTAATHRMAELNQEILHGKITQPSTSARGGLLEKERGKQYFDRGLQHLASYQCSSARYWITRSFAVQNDPRSHTWTGLAAFICGSYDDALSTFTNILEHDETSILIRLQCGLLQYHLGQRNEGIQNIALSVHDIYSSSTDPDLLYSTFMRKHLILTSGKIDRSLFDQIASLFTQEKLKYHFTMKIARKAANWGFFEESDEFYEKAMEYAEENEERTLILNNQGINVAVQNDHKEAISYYRKALDYSPDNHRIHINISTSLAVLGDYQSAIDEMNIVMDHASEDEKEELRKKRDILEKFAKTRINIHAVNNPEIQSSIRTAEVSLVQLKDETGLLEFSHVLGYYSKAVEMMLIDSITNPFAASVRKINNYVNTRKERNCIRHPFFFGNSQISKLPSYLSKLICIEKSLSLGNWKYALRDAANPSANPIEDRFRKTILGVIPSEDLSTLVDACEAIADARNPKQHKETISKTDVLIVREKLITHINNVIRILYPIPQ